jgi:glycosyltransferase involved in cell wall biosynthesis
MPVTFAVGVDGSDSSFLSTGPIDVRNYANADDLRTLIDDCDVVFGQFIDTNVVRYAVNSGKRIVYDLYNVLPAETIGARKISGFTDDEGKDREYKELLSYFRFCASAGSYFVASNERQRDFWLGFLLAAEGTIPSDFGARSAEDIIGLTPFGLEDSEPQLTSHGLRGKHGIEDDDIVLIWAGGIWEWFDATTVIEAVASIAQTHPNVKLVFYGTTHPNKVVGRPATVDDAIARAESLGVLGSNVIFLDDWVPAAERANFLLDADIAVSAHRPGLETHFAFRTRVLDHFWARLPSVVTDGDWFADMIRDNDLGIVVPSKNVKAFRDGILALALHPDRRREIVLNIEGIRELWRWHSTTAELSRTILEMWEKWPVRILPVHCPEPIAPPTILRRAVRRARRDWDRMLRRRR